MKELVTISSFTTPSTMATYSIYLMCFLTLLYVTGRNKSEFVVDSKDLKYILIGLILFCLSNLISRILIRYELKRESYEIINPHFLLLAIVFFLFYKLNKHGDN